MLRRRTGNGSSLDATGTPPGSPPDRWWVLHVSGELDVATAPDLDARMGRAVALRHGDGLVLDLSAVTFVDCAGLRPVLRGRNRLGRRLCLRAVPARVLRLLLLAEVAGSVRILPGERLWPAEADPGRCGIIFDDLFDHRPARPVLRLPRQDLSVLTQAAATSVGRHPSDPAGGPAGERAPDSQASKRPHLA